MNTDKIIAEKIASEYAPKTASKVEALKKLDRKARRGAEIFAFTFGIIFTLIFGTGMCLYEKSRNIDAEGGFQADISYEEFIQQISKTK